jgi:RHS repeat-associated protein
VTLSSPKFATYFRDATTALDYAQNRYYASTLGRFTTPDPSRNSGGPVNPQSWNRYTYVEGDPINKYDPSGLQSRTTGILPGDGDTDDPFDCDFNSGFNPAPSPFCYNPLPVPIRPVRESVFCRDLIDIPTDAEKVAEVAVLLGEDSWFKIGSKQYVNGDVLGKPTGADIKRSTVASEEHLMLQVISNSAYYYKRSILDEITPGRYAGYARGLVSFKGSQIALAGSSVCQHLITAIESVDRFSRFDITQLLQWRSVVAPGATAPRTQGAFDLRVAGTDFLDYCPQNR